MYLKQGTIVCAFLKWINAYQVATRLSMSQQAAAAKEVRSVFPAGVMQGNADHESVWGWEQQGFCRRDVISIQHQCITNLSGRQPSTAKHRSAGIWIANLCFKGQHCFAPYRKAHGASASWNMAEMQSAVAPVSLLIAAAQHVLTQTLLCRTLAYKLAIIKQPWDLCTPPSSMCLLLQLT